ncbi:O-methyltransferase [Rossellomorea aquimaris]|jgi:predicted O-methyltransferase YrrM|uniref:tRNA 5-hydroxyuridine methyltransferase n=1 Tax=Rossellomorea aquimaris TaxID=189382 RepID=A0A1J6VXV0_9BACI|nr:O-methyltransferase [Rossellomorea aquimaris]OIU70662.1 SAM-dependent methyltransferase [Rossellomorea aquimaris]
MMDEKVINYIESITPKRSPLLEEMEQYAEEHHVPIMELVGIEALLGILAIQQPSRILEIGTAIGYSALRMAEALPETEITTIERDEERYNTAQDFLGRSGHKGRIHTLLGDALELQAEVEKNGPFDAILIDAAKGQYQKFFDLYAAMLSENGVVYSDNVLFKGLVAEEEVEQKRIRNMVKKLQKYNVWLMSHDEFETSILPVGDGIAISKKRGERK